MGKKFSFLTSVLCVFSLIAVSYAFPANGHAQAPSCAFYPVSTPLTDLGANEYYRLTSINPPTYRATGIIGGLYPGGSNQRPAAHEAAGIEIARQIQPLDEAGNPSPNGRIGFASVGMSNTSMEFGSFRQRVIADPAVNDRLRLANSAAGGGVIERWVDPSNAHYQQTWNFFNQQITNYGLTHAQVQVIWAKITQFTYQPNFPADMVALRDQYKLLMHELHNRLPNLKLVFFSSRTRSFSYLRGLSPEPTAFENGFAVRWLIEDQINGDPQLNFKAVNGLVNSPYITWGPYLWIDGLNPRSDGRTWPVINVTSDCTHPSGDGTADVGDMMMEFFKSDVVAAPWFLDPGAPTPTSAIHPTRTATPTPTSTFHPASTPIPTRAPTGTPTRTPTSTCTAVSALTSTPTATATPTTPVPPHRTPTPTLTPTSISSSCKLISSWGFGTDLVKDDINGSTEGAKHNAVWFTPSVASGGYQLNGANAYLDLGSFPYLQNLGAFTLSLWVRPAFDQDHVSSAYAFSGMNGQLFYHPSLHDWRFTIRTTTGTFRLDTQGVQWQPGTWHLLTITYDGASIKSYWDGELSKEVAATGSVYAGVDDAYLGKSYSAPPYYFTGAVDELKVFDGALTASEVDALYTKP